jgi:molybdate transport system ATP-binding protein
MTLRVRIRHAFPGFALDVDLTAPPGLTCLFGRSGSGKTTIINAVAGLLRPDEAEITLDGAALHDLPPHRRRVGYVFQDGRLFPHMTVARNLTYGARVRRLPLNDFDRIVGLLGIGALLERRPAALSGGEKSRVAIGRALMSGPRILLMDEPFAALDEARKAEILPYVEALRDEIGLPILYVSHALPEVARLATTIAVIEAGRLVTVGPAAEVLSDPATAPVMGLAEAGAILTARIAGHEADGLTRLETAAGPIWLPHDP